MASMPTCPPERTLLHRGRPEKCKHELEGTARPKRTMGQVPMVPDCDRPHAKQVASDGQQREMPCGRIDQCERTREMHRDERHAGEVPASAPLRRRQAQKTASWTLHHETPWLFPHPQEILTITAGRLVTRPS